MTEATVEERNARKVREGVVVSNKMDKTAVIAVVERVRHPKYAKFVLRTKKLYAHDEANDVQIGDRVRVMETRPMSMIPPCWFAWRGLVWRLATLRPPMSTLFSLGRTAWISPCSPLFLPAITTTVSPFLSFI